MYKLFSLEHNESHKVWFTSDTHFGHNKEFIFSKRGYSSISDHDSDLVSQWNSVITPNDTVIHCGDFIVGAGRDGDDLGNYLLNTLNGNKVFIWGNHQAFLKTLFRRLVLSQFSREDIEVYPISTSEFKHKVTFVGCNYLCKIRHAKGSQIIYASHFAHRIWIDMMKGRDGIWHVSGHSHSSDPESQPDFLQIKRLDVGIDNFKKPISFDELSLIMKKKSISKIDMHDASTSPSF